MKNPLKDSKPDLKFHFAFIIIFYFFPIPQNFMYFLLFFLSLLWKLKLTKLYETFFDWRLDNFTGAFRLYDVDNDGFITREEMYNIVDAIYQMVVSQK